MAKPFLQCHRRFKNGKDHHYWSIAEKVRTHRGWVQRHLLYLGEINDSQKEAWTKLTEVFDTQSDLTRPLALYPADREVPEHAAQYGVQVRLKEFELRRPRQWGACWVGCQLWDQLQLEEFWKERLPDSREGTSWRHVLQTLAIYRLIDRKRRQRYRVEQAWAVGRSNGLIKPPFRLPGELCSTARGGVLEPRCWSWKVGAAIRPLDTPVDLFRSGGNSG